jgi:carbonic anhydrase
VSPTVKVKGTAPPARHVPDTTLRQLLERNARHAAALPDDHFAAVQDGQSPALVSVCCSDSRVSQEGMWDVDEPGWVFTPSTIGNQVWDRHDGEQVVDGSVLYPMVHTGTTVAAVVGHTGCGAVTAALDAVREGSRPDAPGVRKWVDLLVPVVEDGLADDRVDPDRAAGLVDQLVEYNVDRQVAFLRASEAVPDDVSVYGFVYDFQGVYGDVPGRAYLVNAEGETDTGALRERVPAAFDEHVHRLL